MPDAAGFRPLLTPLLRHPDARIRSKVALLAGEGNGNRTWFERRMLEDDPRVRANALESAGPAVAEDLRPLFRTAASDANNRVAGNALVALYRLGEGAAVAGLYELAARQDPTFRSTAAWAMSETGDTRFLPLLGKILTDPNETTKAAAFRAIRKLRGQESAQTQVLEVRILGKPSFDGPTLKVAFGVSDGCKPVTGIAATKVRILVDGEPVYRYSVVEQDYNRRISAAFLVPRIADQTRERSVALPGSSGSMFRAAARGRLVVDLPVFPFRRKRASVPACNSFRRADRSRGDVRRSVQWRTRRIFEMPSKPRGASSSRPRSWDCVRNFDHRDAAHISFYFVPKQRSRWIRPASRRPRRKRASRCTRCAVRATKRIREVCQATGGFYAISENVTKTLLDSIGGSRIAIWPV